MRIVRRLYDWVLHWAETPYGEWALFAVAFAESSFFPIPPDVLLIALALSIPARALRFAVTCTVGSMVGGLAGYGIGFGLWEIARPLFIPHVLSQQTFDYVVEQYRHHDVWIVFIAAFTPIPYKAITISAGVCHIGLPQFFIASLVGRATRFFLVAALIRMFGKPIRGFIERYFELVTVVFTIGLVGGFVVLRYWSQVGPYIGVALLGATLSVLPVVVCYWPDICRFIRCHAGARRRAAGGQAE